MARNRTSPRPARAWAFDRPVVRDPLLWAGVALGVALAVMSPAPAGSAAITALLDAVLSLLGGVALAGFFGGFVRNLVRALADDDDRS